MKKAASIVILLILLALQPVSLKAAAANSYSSAGQVNTTSGNLNVRSSASSSGTIIAKLSPNSYVTLISKSSSWWYVEYSSGKYGYCYASYINQLTGSLPAYVNITSGYLYVRSGAGTSYSIQAQLLKSTNVVLLSQSGGWSKILYNGTKVGYVSSTYLKTYSTSNAYQAVSLSMPSYKQTDSRWSSYALGSSGKTIGSSGCLTTCLAMTESYRTGTTIYPNSMAAKLTYTSSGTAYWPSNYVFSSESGYLQSIYKMLSSGKPVLIGAKTASGGQHWVVVTGYTGGDSLTASGFTINDPGSSYITNMQQFFSNYPYFYKIAYYN